MKHYLMGGAALLVLSACATKPEPVQEMPAPKPVVQAPAPVTTQPAPAPVIVEQPPEVVEIAPVLDLPNPGSIEDFAYQSGGEPRVFFGYDQFVLSQEARDLLRRQANWMKVYQDSTAVIEGHADERGTREYNLALGARRADSVQAFLISEGIAPSRLRTISYGKERPIDGRPSETGWARNRNGFTNLNLRGVS